MTERASGRYREEQRAKRRRETEKAGASQMGEVTDDTHGANDGRSKRSMHVSGETEGNEGNVWEMREGDFGGVNGNSDGGGEEPTAEEEALEREMLYGDEEWERGGEPFGDG